MLKKVLTVVGLVAVALFVVGVWVNDTKYVKPLTAVCKSVVKDVSTGWCLATDKVSEAAKSLSEKF